jgi:Domain of unknown function (DUF4823)
MKRLVIPIVAAVALAGCPSEYQVQSLSGSQQTTVLSRQGGVYITVPADGRYQDISYPGSGQLVAQVLATAFSKYARTVQTAPAHMQDDGMGEARRAGSQYLVVPVITHWEQRATECSGRPSRMSIRLTIFDVSSGHQLVSEGIVGRTSRVRFTSTSPDELLQEPITGVIDSLYASSQ